MLIKVVYPRRDSRVKRTGDADDRHIFSDKERFWYLSGCLASKCPQWKLFGTF